jgi:hypothetical protein
VTACWRQPSNRRSSPAPGDQTALPDKQRLDDPLRGLASTPDEAAAHQDRDGEVGQVIREQAQVEGAVNLERRKPDVGGTLN